MAPLKLIYFDIAGRAEMIRLALHIGGIEFEDVRVGREEFAANKAGREGKGFDPPSSSAPSKFCHIFI
jgi:hypothetical protein